MTNSQLADLLEEAARRLRESEPFGSQMRTTGTTAKKLTTAQLSEETGVPVWTIRRLAEKLDGVPVGGKTGYRPNQTAILRSHPQLAEIGYEDHLRIITSIKSQDLKKTTSQLRSHIKRAGQGLVRFIRQPDLE